MSYTNFPPKELLTEEAIELVADKLKITGTDMVKGIETLFVNCFVAEESSYAVHHNPLAHLTRAIEKLVKKKAKNPLFRIVIKVLDSEESIPEIGSAPHVPRKSFTAFVHPRMDPRQQRVIIAHELGHLLICELLDKKYTKGEFGDENAATLFGILSVIYKSRFYSGKCQEFVYKDLEVINDFALMTNRPRKSSTKT